MKKTLIIAAAALIAASCTYKSNETSQRTQENLASIAFEMLAESADFAVTLLSNIQVNEDLDLFDPALDTVATNPYYGYKIAVRPDTSADSTWVFTSIDGNSVSFSGTARMTGTNKLELPTFKCSLSGIYDESNALSASFGTPDGLSYSWGMQYSSYGYGSSYVLLREGTLVLYTFNDDTELDSLTITFKDGSYTW